MKTFKCLLTAMLLACSSASFAQFTNGGSSSDRTPWKGVRFSYDRTFVNQDWEGSEDPDMNGFNIGYVHSFSIAKKLPFFFETGLGLGFARYSDSHSYDGESLDEKLTTLGLTVPLNVVYKININDKLALKPYTGFYLRVNLMAKNKWEYSDEDGSVDETYNLFDEDEVGKDGKWNRCQFGWQIGATLDINRFNVGIGYALDFNEIADKTKCGIFSARVGYNF